MNLNNAFYGFFAALTKIDEQYLQVWLLPRAPYSAARQRGNVPSQLHHVLSQARCQLRPSLKRLLM